MASVREETARGIKWGLIQKCTMQPVQFIFGIILARLISPEEMGILGLTGIFFAFAGQLQECGFGSALIRKQDRTDEDICTVFWFNIAMSFVLSLALFLAAPWFVWFFDQPALLNLTRVSALLMFLGSTGSVHWTLYSARRDFKTPAIVSMCTTLVAMPFTIWAAYAGWSYWAPMLQGIISGLLGLITIWIISPWKPRFKFSRESFISFFGFGVKLTTAGMITTGYSQLRTFLIGKFYSPAQLAYFSRGYTTCSTPMGVINSLLGGVTYPILASLQYDKSRLIHVYRQYIRLTSLVVEWGMLTMAANAHSFIGLLYGESWLPCVPYAQLLCFGIMLDPLYNINSNLYAILGRTDITLKRETILRIFGISAMLIGAWHSVMGICIAALLTSLFAFSLTCFMTSRTCSLSFKHQLQDFLPYLFMALVANIPSIITTFFPTHPFIDLFIGGSCSLAIYIGLLTIRRDKAGAYVFAFLKEKISRSFNKQKLARRIQSPPPDKG